jgi:cephalosporin hydroxylase
MKVIIEKSETDRIEFDIYSKEGFDYLTELWLKSSFFNKAMYESTWLGIPIIQFPDDMVIMQELIWKLRPDMIIETGVAHGGSAILSASILELIGSGKVIGIDIEIRKYNDLAIRAHPLSHRIELVEGSSVEPETVRKVGEKIRGSKNALVILDSDHSFRHVLAEMEIYSRFVSPGGYMVVMDGIQEMLSDTPSAKPGWENDNPLRAIRKFLDEHGNWEIDPYYNRIPITCNPQGFLRRLS